MTTNSRIFCAHAPASGPDTKGSTYCSYFTTTLLLDFLMALVQLPYGTTHQPQLMTRWYLDAVLDNYISVLDPGFYVGRGA